MLFINHIVYAVLLYNWLGNFYLVLKYLLLALVTFSRATAIRKAATQLERQPRSLRLCCLRTPVRVSAQPPHTDHITYLGSLPGL